ncbi:MAG: hypothetical protein BWK76_18385 [Desulfobulbaceae bacterium A2]|nr:MAG: hypothetical protein BWK76_18385 [Desulfobulbaceae bacterium A2]
MGLRAYQDNFWSYVDYIRYLVDMVGRYENAKIFGFDDMTFPDDISNYMDQSHFSADISSILLQSMAGGEHELRQDNVEKYIADYIEMVAAYDLKTLAHDFERCLVR